MNSDQTDGVAGEVAATAVVSPNAGSGGNSFHLTVP